MEDGAEPSFDPGGFYEFDLARGAVRTRDGARVLVLSDDVVGPLVSGAVKNGDLTAIRRLGKHLGESAAKSMGKNAGDLSPETVLGHASSVLALMGWGRLRFEQWGDALVASLDGLPALDAQNWGVASLLGGLFGALGGREVACVPVGTSGQFVLLDPAVAERVWPWVQGGADLGTIVGRLTAEGA